ncbi:MAG TPA: endonuclease/exonuclease/phosphatase family protein [Polyangia bacterium]|nr:endonuclease/exonuclease/phosphatase family protein [Polyangia bacterium]
MRRVRLVTWNVGRLYTPTDNNRLDDADVPRVARVLHELDPDVALLQEFVEPRQLDALLALLPEYRGRLAERCRYDRHVAALARASLAPEFEQHLLDETGRGLVGVTFSVGRARGFALAVHFDVFDRARRRNQIEAVAELVDARREPLIAVGGDFNLDPEFSARIGHADADSYRLLSGKLPHGARPTHHQPTLMGLLRVDHLLAGGALVERSHSRVSPNRRLPMGDHDPLIADLHLTVAVDAVRATS